MMNELNKVASWLAAQPERHTAFDVQSLPGPTFRCDGTPYVSFSSNNYLGLAQAARTKKAARRALEQYGVGNCESRLLTGDLDIYHHVEAKLAGIKKKDAALIFATGYLTNLGVLSGMVRWPILARAFGYNTQRQYKYVFFSDEYNHVSIKEGIRLSGAAMVTYLHADLDDLEEKLASHPNAIKIIATDGVFSQDGDIAPLSDLLELANQHNATVYVDDAHGTGVLGATGGGTSEHFGIVSPRLIQMGTLSKAYGAIGGFVAADIDLIQILRLSCPAYGFTSTIPPDQAVAISEAIDMVTDEPERRARLWSNQRRFVTGLNGIGLRPISDSTPIVPLMVGQDRDAEQVAASLRYRSMHVDVVRFPAVKLDSSRLRFIMNAEHTDDQIDELLDLLREQADLGRLVRARRTPQVQLKVLTVNGGEVAHGPTR